MMNIIYAVAVLGILGGVFGAVLAFAAKIFYVEQDERIDQIVAVLPGANCGGCGYAGCANCASEIVAGNAKVNACPVGALHEKESIDDVWAAINNPDLHVVVQPAPAVRATIGDQTASCKVNVSFDPKPATEPKYKLSHTDVTLYVGDPLLESFRITLTDKEGVNIDAEWTVSDEGYVTINGRNITAVKATSDLAKRAVTVSATVDGETYTCTVRVAEKPTEETQSGT